MFKKLLKKTIEKEVQNKIQEMAENYKKNKKKEEIPFFVEKTETADFSLSIKKTMKNFKCLNNPNYAMDGADVNKTESLEKAFLSNTNDSLNGVVFNHFARQGFIGFQACAILSQNWLINKCCSVPVDDAIRIDYETSFVNPVENEDKADILTEIKVDADDVKKFDIKGFCRKYGINKRIFGFGLCVPIVEGVNMELPFNIDSIEPDSYKGMSVIDPYWISPEFDEEGQSKPESKDFFVPTWYRMPNGKLIHKSWFIWGTYGEVPDILKPTYSFSGYPLTQLLYERVFTTEKIANEAYMLTMSKRLMVMDGNLNEFILNQDKYEKQVKALTNCRDNWGVVVKDRESSIQQIDTSLSDFDNVLMSQLQLCCSIADIPTTKLLNTQPKGFNTSGDYETKQYNTLLAQIQNQDFLPILKKHFQLQMKSKYGIVEDFAINFKPIDVPTEKENAEINNLKADYYSKLSELGSVDGTEIRDKLIKDPTSGFNNLQDVEKENLAENNFFAEEETEENNKQ